MGCGCAGVERAALTIAAAGGGAKILAPQGKSAVVCHGAALVLQGVAIEGRGGGTAVLCGDKVRAELSGCTLTSPKGTGLGVVDGATATMDGGSISGCGEHGVCCEESGATATVRPQCHHRKRSLPKNDGTQRKRIWKSRNREFGARHREIALLASVYCVHGENGSVLKQRIML